MNYFTSDTHFGHTNILLMERPQFSTIQEHDNCILRQIESLKEDDTLYIAGDLMFARSKETCKRLKEAKCSIILIRGNHDRYKDYFYTEELGIQVIDHPLFLSNRVILSHFPYQCAPEVLNLHGHLHGSIVDKPNYINLNIAVQNYRLFPEKKISQKLNTMPSWRDSLKFTQEWWYPIQKVLPEYRSLTNKVDENGFFVKK